MATQLDLKWVRETEDRLGGPLPADYVAVLRRRNGWYGVFDDEQWHFFSIFDKTDRKSTSKTAECIDRETTSLRKGFPYFPRDGVVVADNQAGSYLYIRLDGTSDLFRFELDGATSTRVGDVGDVLDTALEW